MCASMVCCRVLQIGSVWCSMLQCVAVCGIVLQCVAVCCSALVIWKVWRNILFVKHTAFRASNKAKKHPSKHIFPKKILVALVRIRTRSTRYFSVSFVTGCLRLVGFLILYVSFVEYSLCYTALLQKRPIKRDLSKETCHFKEPTNRSHPIEGS